MSDERIRQLAYEIWHSEGRPHGQDKRHWDMAAKLVEAETAKAPSKPRAPRKPISSCVVNAAYKSNGYASRTSSHSSAQPARSSNALPRTQWSPNGANGLRQGQWTPIGAACC